MPVQDRELGEKLSPVRDAPCRAGLLGTGGEQGMVADLPGRCHDSRGGPRSGGPGNSYGDGVRSPNRVRGMVVAQGADGQWTGGLEEVSELSHGGTRASDQEDGRGTH